MTVRAHARRYLLRVVATALSAASAIAPASAEAKPPRLALLGVRLQNDNEGLEPTTDVERHRLALIGEQFTSTVSGSGAYALVPVTPAVQAEIASGQPVGQCGGCEATLGKKLGADRVAWITVQKVSNLI